MSHFIQLRSWGLRLKILVWSFVPTMLALVAVGLVSFYAFQTTTRVLLIERNRELIRVLATQLSGELDTYPKILTDLAGTPGFVFRRSTLLSEASRSLAMFDGGIVVTDDQGVVVAALPENSGKVGQDWSNRNFFLSMLRSMQPTYSDVTDEGPDGKQGVVVAVPVTGQMNEFQGIVAGIFRLDVPSASTFYGDIVRLRIGQSEEAHLSTYLVDGKGKVIYHTDSQRIGEDFSRLTVVQNILSGKFKDGFSNLDSRGMSFRGSAGAIRTRDTAGTDVVAYFASVPNTSWGLVTESSWNGLLSYYRTYLYVQSLLFVLGVLAPALLVNNRIRRITEPIYEIKKAVEDVAGGRYGHLVHVKTGDELEELGEGFNHMSLQLSQSYAALKEREERLTLVMRGANDGIWDWNLQTNEVYFSPRWKGMLGFEDHEIAHRFEEWQKLIHPDDAALAGATVKGYVEKGEGTFYLEHRLRSKNGEYRWILARGILLKDEQGTPVRMVGSHSDITKRKQAEDALRKAYETMEEKVEERTRHLGALNNISSLVSRSLDITQTLNDALDKILEITQTDVGAAYRLEGQREGVWPGSEEVSKDRQDQLFLNPLVCRNIPDEFCCAFTRLPVKGSGMEVFLDTSEPEICEAALDGSGVPPAFRTLGLLQCVSIPLKVKSRLLGVIQVGNRQQRIFSTEEINLLSAIGQQVGVSAENARLHEAVQQTATLEERARLARELHDSVTQSLYSVTLLAEAATRLMASGDTQTAAGHLKELREAAQESLREMRLLIYELRPVALEKSGLADALRLRLEAVETRAGIKTELIVEGKENLSYDQKSELYQIAQETLNNILKHSHATQVQIRILYLEGTTQMEIQDDGVGFDTSLASHSGGMGLPGLVERAEKIGARLDVTSSPGRGTKVTVATGTRFDPVFN